MKRACVWIAILGGSGCILASGVASGGSHDLIISPIGPVETVFVHSKDACRPDDTPDAPARAFRDHTGRIHLVAGNLINFAFVGSDLGTVKRDCKVVYQGARSDDPARFDDGSWLMSFWTNDGKTVYALIDNEFQGNLRPTLCPSKKYFECWYNSITAGVSVDGGSHFSRAGNVAIAAPLYPFNPDYPRRPVGYFTVSNIVILDGYYYAMVWAENVGDQKRGNCLLRTNDLAMPNSWRAWDGFGFSVHLAGGYPQTGGMLGGRPCLPIAPGHLIGQVSALVVHQPTGHYLAVMAVNEPRPAFMFSESADLLTWSDPAPILDNPEMSSGKCAGHSLYAYPSFLDDKDKTYNFYNVSSSAYLYFTKFNFGEKCEDTVDRDLIRIRINIFDQ